jgi:hypothetical protein
MRYEQIKTNMPDLHKRVNRYHGQCAGVRSLGQAFAIFRIQVRCQPEKKQE